MAAPKRHRFESRSATGQLGNYERYVRVRRKRWCWRTQTRVRDYGRPWTERKRRHLEILLPPDARQAFTAIRNDFKETPV